MLADQAQKAAIAFTPRQLIMLMAALSVFAFLGLTVGTQASLPVRILLVDHLGRRRACSSGSITRRRSGST